jgi:hypothetical protein
MPNAKMPKGDEEEYESKVNIVLKAKVDHSKRITPEGRAFAERRKAEVTAVEVSDKTKSGE